VTLAPWDPTADRATVTEVDVLGDRTGRALDGRDVGCRVLVVDDHALVAAGLVVALQDAGLVAEVCVPTTAASVLDPARDQRPHVVLLDLVLEGAGVSALDLIAPLLALDAEVVAFTGSNDAALLAAVVELGVNGILHKSAPFDELVDGVQRAAAGEALLNARRRAELRDQAAQHRRRRAAELAPFEALTPREVAVLVRMMEGESAEAIAEASFVSLATVRSQIRGVLTKLGVTSQLAAVAAAHRAGWGNDLRSAL